MSSCQDRIPEEEPDTDSQGIFFLNYHFWKSKSTEKYQTAYHLFSLTV